MSRACVAAIVALVGSGCSQRAAPASDRAQTPATASSAASAPAPASATAASAPAAGATSTSAPTAPPADKPLTFADGSEERKLQNFCIDNFQKLHTCFGDQQFWDILATIFFAQNPGMDDGTPRARSLWIGMRKDDFAGLMREKRVPADCEASIRHSRWPTAATIDRVTKARAGGCPGFANAFGSMLFVEGAFSQPR